MLCRASRGLQRDLAFACSHTRTRHRALSHALSERGAAREFAACARCAAVVEVGPCPINDHSVSEAALSLGARACLDVLATASDEQPAFACAHTRTRHRVLSLGRWRITRAYCMCVSLCAGWSRSMSIERLLCHLEGPLFRRTAALRRASRGLRRAAGVRVCAHASAPLRALFREEAQHTRLRHVRALPRLLKPFYVQ